MFKKAEWVTIAKDRLVVLLLLAMAVETLAIIITTLVRIHVSDVQVPVRYSSYGTANIYRDQWYSMWSFSVFAVLIVMINGFLGVKIYQINRLMGRGIVAFTIFILVVELFVVNAIFNLAPTA